MKIGYATGARLFRTLPAGFNLFSLPVYSLSMSEYYYFGSGSSAPYHRFSNFHHAPIRVAAKDVTESMAQLSPELRSWIGDIGGFFVFPSAEHVWHALKAKNVATLLRFTSHGDLGQWSASFFTRVMPKALQGTSAGLERGKKKMAYWHKKGNIGIMAKMAANPKYTKAMGFDPRADMNYGRETLEEDLERRVWLSIHHLKYSQHAALRTLLLETGETPLIEFDRAGIRNPSKTKWGGCVDEKGVLHGQNKMGMYLMLYRRKIAGPSPPRF
jgi:predicted NAD-dependent protein-ADP-ribosyltransferase YbiA (DUF1768 family)